MIRNCVKAIMLATSLGIVGCGGGGSAGDTAMSITGLCETCDSDVDCEEGLSCQACLDGCTDTSKRCVGLSNQTNTRLSCDGTSYPGGCVNVSGSWTITEEINGQCVVAGDDIDIDQSGTGTVSFNQSGCNVTYRVPQIDAERSGVIVGHRMRLGGPFLATLDGSFDLDLDENRAHLEGTVLGNTMSLMGEGSARGRIEGESLTCSGMSIADGFR